jgi:TPR repeat protein
MLESAAAKNHSGAMLALGALNHGGYGLPKDLAVSEKWLRREPPSGTAKLS